MKARCEPGIHSLSLSYRKPDVSSKTGCDPGGIVALAFHYPTQFEPERRREFTETIAVFRIVSRSKHRRQFAFGQKESLRIVAGDFGEAAFEQNREAQARTMTGMTPAVPALLMSRQRTRSAMVFVCILRMMLAR